MASSKNPGITPIAASDIEATFSRTCIDLISSSLGGAILHKTDDFFAPATSLLLPHAPIQKPNTYVPTGAWYDGWESRRHNPTPPDTCVIKLGVAAGRVSGLEIDTAFFAGNHPSAVSVDGCHLAPGHDVLSKHTPWTPILPLSATGPSQRHAWLLSDGLSASAPTFTHVRLHMHPDGGIARFRLYGRACPPPAALTASEEVDLASCLLGARVVAVSDERFGRAGNLLLPGRGHDMRDGWETARSRAQGHEDWAVIRLACGGELARVDVDMKDFKGNFPRRVRVEALDWPGEGEPGDGEKGWVVLDEVEGVGDGGVVMEMDGGGDGGAVTHVKVVMVPDGGVKRVRVWGKPKGEGGAG